MDISSKYFSLLRYPNPYLIKHLWRFLLDIYRVGKVRELVSFVLWEINHQLRLYKVGNRYVQFTEHKGLSITNEVTSPDGNVIISSFLVEAGLCFHPVAVDWKYCVQNDSGTLWGCCYSHPNALYSSNDQSQSAVLIYEFTHPITSLFISQRNALFICSNGIIYKSDDLGNSFNVVLQLSTSISYFLFNNGMTELPDHKLMIGEYGSVWKRKKWQNLAFLYYSSDEGDTWTTSDFLVRQGVNKHIHLVKYCAYLNTVLLTDGDNKKQVWSNETLTHFDKQANKQKGGWHLVNRYHHQTGGYTSMAETNNSVLFGSDYLGGTNFIVKTSDGKQFEKLVLPDPYRRSPVMNMIARQSLSGTEVWASSYSCLSGDAKSLLMCTKDSGKSWARVIEFDGTKNEVRLVNSSNNRSNSLYISITEFGCDQEQHRYRTYKLQRNATIGCDT